MQVAHCYPQLTQGFPEELMALLGKGFSVLAPPTRLVLVKALVLLHNRGRLTSLQAVPFFLKLFRHHAKAVRQLLFQHILAGGPPCSSSSCLHCRAVIWPCLAHAGHQHEICEHAASSWCLFAQVRMPSSLSSTYCPQSKLQAFPTSLCASTKHTQLLMTHAAPNNADVKAANRKARNDQVNRALQNVLFATLGEPNELAAKKALGLLTELWRRQLWHDARTANVIGARAPERTCLAGCIRCLSSLAAQLLLCMHRLSMQGQPHRLRRHSCTAPCQPAACSAIVGAACCKVHAGPGQCDACSQHLPDMTDSRWF